MLPTSPLPWHWHVHINRGILAGIIVLAIAGAVASVLIQRSGSDEDDAGPGAEASASPPVRKALRGMTVAQKVDAVVVAGVGDPASAEAQLRGTQLGGVFVGAEAWAAGGAGALRRLSAAGAEGGRVPPLIVGRQEGGGYRAYPDLPPAQTELQLGDTGDPAVAEASAQETAEAMKQAGFDLNLAPVADVATIASPIADRAYSDDAALAAAMTGAAARGCKAGGIACAFSHFPGLGGANADTATTPATVSLDAASLDARDLEPFRAAFKAGAPATVLSLAFYAGYDPITPAALSPGIATDLLRGELGFKGVAVTDDLTSGAISAGVGAPEAAVQSIAAGADLVVVGDAAEAERTRAAMLQAAKAGGISSDRLDEAVVRVLELKRKLGLLPR
jgi:beta-N-acetylhexosaminidase